MVELRSCDLLHSIRAIKDKSIKIAMNMNARGISKLKFRSLVDIYSQEDNKDDELTQNVVRDLDYGSDMRQGSCVSGADVNASTDPDLLNMTLEKFREECKEKKRKLRENKYNQEHLTLLNQGCDPDKPLSSWTTKLSKRRKKNQKPETMCGFNSTPFVREERVDLRVLCDVNPEARDDSCSVTETMSFVSADSSLDCNKEAEPTTNTELVEEIMHDPSKDTRLVLYCSPEKNLPETVAIEETITTKPMEKGLKDTSGEFYGDNLDLQENVLYASVSREETELEAPQNSEYDIIGCLKDLISSNTDSRCEGEVIEDEESNDPKPSLDMAIACMEIVKTEAPEVLATDYSILPIMDVGVENTDIEWETEDVTNNYLPETTDIVQLYSLDNLHSLPEDCTISLQEDQLTKRSQEQPASSGHVDEAEDDKSPQLCNATKKVTTAAETDNIQQQKLQNQPGKLLSGRKAISPTSQAQLCKAMKQPDTPEKRSKKSRGKLYFSSQYSHRILKAEGLDKINIVEVNPSSKHTIRKDKTQKPKCQRATHKLLRQVTRATNPLPFSTGCASLKECTQKVIEFSQGQMRGFQHVAAKFSKDLKSMRQITERCLLAQSNNSNMPDYNLDKVKALIKSVEINEKSSNNGISMIGRDCNRFCKLMGMVREDSPATENIVQKKKKKKIKFADDEGGDLCHVKVFELDSESES